MKPFIDFYWLVQDFINGHEFAWIPLDIWAHSLVSILVTVVLLKNNIRTSFVLLMVLVIAMVKEVIDWQFQVKISFEESIKDILVTMTYPSLVFLIQKYTKQKG